MLVDEQMFLSDSKKCEIASLPLTRFLERQKMDFNVTDDELAKALDITKDELYNICDIFDDDPDDSWELIEGAHFQWGAYKTRIFSYEGAVEICNYLEEDDSKKKVLSGRSKFSKFTRDFKRWFFQRDRALKGLMVTKRVQETSRQPGHLVMINNRAFLHPRSCRQILGLGTRQDILNRTFVELVRSENIEIEPPRKDYDFLDHGGRGRYFSGSGLALIGKQLSQKFTQKHRRIWAEVVSEYAPKAVAYIEKIEREKPNEIKSKMDKVRKSANGKCQVSGRRQSVEKFDLEVHHIYDRKTYPQVAEDENNMIAIASDIHTEFHKWVSEKKCKSNEGCTVDDFIEFIEERSQQIFIKLSEDQKLETMMKLRDKLDHVKQSLSGHLN
jgi:5-methylcytosine-specific restriction endonuclease McrA